MEYLRCHPDTRWFKQSLLDKVAPVTLERKKVLTGHFCQWTDTRAEGDQGIESCGNINYWRMDGIFISNLVFLCSLKFSGVFRVVSPLQPAAHMNTAHSGKCAISTKNVNQKKKRSATFCSAKKNQCAENKYHLKLRFNKIKQLFLKLNWRSDCRASALWL